MVTKKSLSVLKMAYISLGAVLIALCSWISVPATVPFTLQTFAVLLVCDLLGGRWGLVSVLLYLLLGAVGFPVFSGFSGGLGHLLGMTGGYILGFVLSALVMALMQRLAKGRKTGLTWRWACWPAMPRALYGLCRYIPRPRALSRWARC